MPQTSDQRHSEDFRSVFWHGTLYSFSPTQAAIVRALWAAAANHTPEVGGPALLEAAGSESSYLSHLFQGHAAWGKFIVPGRSLGSYRLAVPVDEGVLIK